MKVLKLSVLYDGWYGGSVNECCLLPIEWNGLYTEKLDLGLHKRAVYLGEIEGKHSEVYGDLIVEEIDIDKYNAKELSNLLKSVDNSEFEITFEGWEDDFKSEYEDDEEEHEEILLKQKTFEDELGIEFEYEYEIKSMRIAEKLIEKLKDSCVKLKTITINESDFKRVIEMLEEQGIKIF